MNRHTKHVRVPLDHCPKVGIDSIFPLILQRRAVGALQTHVGHSPGNSIKAGRKSNNIKLIFTLFCKQSLFGELDNIVSTVLADVNYFDMGLVDNLEVVGLEAGTLHAKGVRRLFWEE